MDEIMEIALTMFKLTNFINTNIVRKNHTIGTEPLSQKS